VSIIGLGSYASAAGGAFQIRYNRATGAKIIQGGSRDTPTDQLIIGNGGELFSTATYNTIVGGTNRDVFVDNAGTLGYVSSTRASKTNIENISDTSWLLELNPVSFNYRKRDSEGNYTEEPDGPVDFGLIAEEAETVKPELCFYDEVDGVNELRGIKYSKLITPMLKLIQELKAELDEAKARIATLEAGA
jgi:hypothetical protein